MSVDRKLYDLVVVGSSAGGIEALSLLVSTLPADFRAQPARALFGASTRDAVEAWPHLDIQARLDWVRVCQLVHITWMEDIRSVTEAAD